MAKNGLFFRFRVGISTLYKFYVSNLDRSKFGYIADDVTLSPPLILTHPENIFLYGDNGIKRATINADSAKFIMKPHSGAAEGFRVSTGNHTRIIGRFYRTIKQEEKPKIEIQDIVIESDVWIGRNVTLLSGVHIGRGCTIGAGAVVTKSTPPYYMVAGVPARPIKRIWTIDEILEHEEKLYPEEERFTREQLEKIYSEIENK